MGICKPFNSPTPPSTILTLHMQYHSDGRPRNTPLPSTIHGWLTKMRGTLLDNEPMRHEGIKEMKQAKRVRAERELLGKPSSRHAAKGPLIPFSFLRNRPKVTGGTPSRPAYSHRKSSSGHTQRRRTTSSHQRPRRASTADRRSSRRPSSSRKPSSSSRHNTRRSR